MYKTSEAAELPQFLELNIPANAYVQRQAPGSGSVLDTISLPEGVIVTGWSDANNLLTTPDYYKFRGILKAQYYSQDSNYRRAGYAAGVMWQFINSMKIGDWVVVPGYNSDFYVATIVGDAYEDTSSNAFATDTRYRRQVRWLNNSKPISRNAARSALNSRLKVQQTAVGATDLIPEIEEALRSAQSGSDNDASLLDRFDGDVRKRVVETVLDSVKTGFMSERGFELLLKRLTLSMGAAESVIVPRRNDKGVDIRATFSVGGVTLIRIAIQAKYHSNITDITALNQLVAGMKEEGFTIGWLISSASFDIDTEQEVERLREVEDLHVSLIDGQILAELLVNDGFKR